VADYALNADETANAVRLLHTLKERLGARRVAEIEAIVTAGDLVAAVEILLVEYYDPLYAKQINRGCPPDLEVSGDDIPAAAQSIATWAQHLAGQPAVG
jgi:HPt (histidine-containing phosphotransfer) domain-containing protein